MRTHLMIVTCDACDVKVTVRGSTDLPLEWVEVSFDAYALAFCPEHAAFIREAHARSTKRWHEEIADRRVLAPEDDAP
jgi:hypothetical protein